MQPPTLKSKRSQNLSVIFNGKVVQALLIGVSIKNFALLEEFDFGITAADLTEHNIQKVGKTHFPLKRMSAIIGRNNSGKSFFFEALDFLGDCLRFNVPYASTLYNRGGFSKLHTKGTEGKVSFELLYLTPWSDELLNYSLELTSDAYGRPQVESEKVLSIPVNKDIEQCIKGSCEHAQFKAKLAPVPQLLMEFKQGKGGILSDAQWEEIEFVDVKSPALASFGKMLKYKGLRSLYQFITGIFFLRELADGKGNGRGKVLIEQGGHRHIDRNAANVRNVLSYLKQEDHKEFRRMMQRIEDRIPSTQRMGDLLLDRGITSGESKLFIILLLLQDPKPRPLILLENPDVGLYHDMVEELGNAFRDYAMRPGETQLLFSTHSSILLEALNPLEVWVLKRPKEGVKRSYLQMVEDIAPVSPIAADDEEEANEAEIIHSGSKATCIAASPIVRAMYKEGIGLGALWYAGHFDVDSDFVYE